MMFNVRAFLRAYNVDFVTEGPNVKEGNINIKCPFCGAADPSYHLGIDPQTGRWGCWRNSKHSGPSPIRLVKELLGCTWMEAEVLVTAGGFPLPEDLSEEVRKRLLTIDRFTLVSRPALKMPKAFVPIKHSGLHKRFWNYLISRGFEPAEIATLVKTYPLRCCLSGDYGQRIIFPIYYEDDLVAWTGRAISDRARLRYKSSGPVEKELLLFYNNLLAHPVSTLCVVEGPFDALKLDFYGREHGVRATCPFGSVLSNSQVNMLAYLAGRYKRLVIIPDRGAASTGLLMASKCAWLGVRMHLLPDRIEDPAALNKEEVKQLCSLLTI